MSKPVLLLMAPVTTVSGYGARSRDIATALIKSDKYDVKIWPTRWGSTPMNALSDNNPKHKAIFDRLLPEPKLDQQPEIFVQITVPNEFQKMGKYNIGITAGIETTIASAPWIEGCNRMDLVLTSSEHSKKVLESSVWAQVDNNTKQQIGELKLTAPIEVLFEGVDLETYFKTNKFNKTVVDQLKQVKQDFAFLYVGHWLNGDLGEDRKNVGMLIRCFLEAFKGKASHNQPALILKTSHADFSPIDRDEVLKKINAIYKSVATTKSLPEVYLLHGDLSDEEMNSLYNHPKVKAHITLTKGEGYGRPLAEASLSQKPVIAPNWSGHIDFLKHGVLLPGQLTNVHHSAAWDNVILKESQWMTVDYGFAVNMIKSMVEDYKNYLDGARKQAAFIKKEFSFDAMCEKLQHILDTKVPEFPKQVQLKLPSLKRIELPTLKKVKDEQPVN
jgi:hypothetical protein